MLDRRHVQGFVKIWFHLYLETHYSVILTTDVLHFIQAKETCKDLDPHGCAVNPDLCLDPILAMVTCPRTCNVCGKSQCFHRQSAQGELL